MQNEHEMLGEIIKNARMKADITVEDLAAKVGVGERFIYRIENEGKKPSYDILYKLIRELSMREPSNSPTKRSTWAASSG